MLRSGFLASAASRGVSIFFKMMDVSRHHSTDALRGYVRDAELFQITLARACWQVRADHLRTIGRIGGVGYVSSLFCLLCNAANTPLCPFAGSRIAAKQFQFPRWMTPPAAQSIVRSVLRHGRIDHGDH